MAANRRNAQRSTGPRSEAGKIRSSRNDLKHGLAIALAADPYFANEVSPLAEAIAGDAREDGAVLALAKIVAEAELDLIRVRQARVELLNRIATDPTTFELRLPRWLTPKLLERMTAPSSKPIVEAGRARFRKLLSTPFESPSEREAAVLTRGAPELARMDRYERRALSRRRRAIRAFDLARAERAFRANGTGNA
jgi:hypothetical protein